MKTPHSIQRRSLIGALSLALLAGCAMGDGKSGTEAGNGLSDDIHVKLSPNLQAAERARALRAASVDQVEELRVRGLSAYAGKSLHVFYVSGFSASLDILNPLLTVRSIKTDPVVVPIDAAGEATVPAITIPKNSTQRFNYIYFGITPATQRCLYLRNPKGDLPEDPRRANFPRQFKDSDFSAERTGFISLERLRELRSDGGAIVLEAGKDF